jgi:hypothetical protein
MAKVIWNKQEETEWRKSIKIWNDVVLFEENVVSLSPIRNLKLKTLWKERR